MKMYCEGFFPLPYIAAIAATAVAILWFLFSEKESKATRIDATVIDNNTEASTLAFTLDSVAAAGGEYEVFLSFSGIDTRKGFTDFLYTNLVGASIKTFRDNDELRVGEEISLELLKSIQESKISIPIFSQNYASSKWCLLELQQIVECHENKGQMIYPIFYDVDPSDVRNQRGSYKMAFREHRKNFSNETVLIWRKALRMVGGLKGLELKKETDGRQGQLVKLVVEKVLLGLKKNYTHVPENLVGMDNHTKQLMGLLEVDSQDVRIVGIHGMGGLGKTTIAKVIYNKLCERFESQCFLDDVREKSKYRNGMVDLQKQLISNILHRRDECFSEVNEGKKRINDVICGKKLLIVLDDVDDISQVKMLMGDLIRFGAQSRIILTTRDKEVLDDIGLTCQMENPHVVYRSYELDLMDDRLALQLFSKYAFMRDTPMERYKIYSEEVVSIAAGLPLVLVVLGSTLFLVKELDLWEEKLRQLREIQHDKVLEKLRTSFDALKYQEQQMFLDIACFLIGTDTTRASYMWENCEFFPKLGIRVLISKSLIKVGDKNELIMHDQLRDLGRQIVREEGRSKLWKQSRLWRTNDTLQILETHQEARSVNGLHLESHNSVAASHFYNLPNLRYLSMTWVDNVYGDFKHFLPNLKWLQCTGTRGKFCPNKLNMKNLVVLHLSDVQLTDDWDGWNQLKMANNLKVLDLSCCNDLQSLPNMSNLTKLVELNLSSCGKLIEFQGLDKLESLQVLNIKCCCSFQTLPNISNLKELKLLNALKCGKLTQIEGLEALINLEHLDLTDNFSLKGLGDLSNLNKLQVLRAPGLDRTNFSNFKNLKVLEIYRNNNIDIQGLARLEFLTLLWIVDCRSLERLPDLPNFGMLKHIYVWNCDNLQEVEGLGIIESLESLDISGCDQLSLIPDLRSLKFLKKLRIQYLKDLTEIHGVEELESLELLDISGCSSVVALPNISALQKLKHLDVSSCRKLSEIHGIEELKCLTYLNICGCKGLGYLPDLPNVNILRQPYGYVKRFPTILRFL